MNRREAVAGIFEGRLGSEDDPVRDLSEQPFANIVLPTVPHSGAGLEPYTGIWGLNQILHLLRRTTYGAPQAAVPVLQTMSMEQGVNMILAQPAAEESMPLTTDSREELAAIGESWVYTLFKKTDSTFTPTNIRTTSLKAWWMGLMLTQPLSIREKMVLFWHNHFVTERDTVNDPRFIWRYVALLRSNALGNWKDLTRLITTDGAMLRYLNGNTNTKTSANENYGRELQELFTIGKGPEVAPGDYTFYTEQDVKEAARVLTGWQDDATVLPTPGSQPWKFTASRHDTTNKQFSIRYGNRVITGGTDGVAELNALLNMIFEQEETAKYLCRRLYRWFVYYVIDDWTETNIIVPLANILRSNNYAVGPVLDTLLKSAHFYDTASMGCMIKSPIDIAVGIARGFGMGYPTDLETKYKVYSYMVTQAAAMQQDLGDPPSVAGWSAYYQTPQFYQTWINSDTLPRRTTFSNTLVRTGYKPTGFTYNIDPIAFALNLSNPRDPVSLVEESARYLFAIPITESQKAFLRGVLVSGLPEYIWSNDWDAYIADPGTAAKVTAVKTKLQNLYAFMLSMPEYQLQ
jgi:uncharacterized protein (DUF1800 family)